MSSLLAIIDWFSRYVLAWERSTTMDTSFCLEALDRALQVARPQIFTTDQGVQLTSKEFTGCLQPADIRISWDGRARALDTIFVERLWRSVNDEEVYLKDSQTVPQAREGLPHSFNFYHHERYHQSLDDKTPFAVYRQDHQRAIL